MLKATATATSVTATCRRLLLLLEIISSVSLCLCGESQSTHKTRTYPEKTRRSPGMASPRYQSRAESSSSNRARPCQPHKPGPGSDAMRLIQWCVSCSRRRNCGNLRVRFAGGRHHGAPEPPPFGLRFAQFPDEQRSRGRSPPYLTLIRPIWKPLPVAQARTLWTASRTRWRDAKT